MDVEIRPMFLNYARFKPDLKMAPTFLCGPDADIGVFGS